MGWQQSPASGDMAFTIFSPCSSRFLSVYAFAFVLFTFLFNFLEFHGIILLKIGISIFSLFNHHGLWFSTAAVKTLAILCSADYRCRSFF